MWFAAVSVSVGCCSMMMPQAYRSFIKHEVSGRVVSLTSTPWNDSGMKEGGTGFHVKAPSGKTYIVSNRHVCGYDKAFMWANIDGHVTDRKVKIMQISDQSDLCILEGIPGVEGLRVGDTPSVDDEVMYLGHPRLQPRTLVSGEVIGATVMSFSRGPIDDSLTAERCKASKDSYIVKVPEIYVLIQRFRMGGGVDGMGSSKFDEIFDTKATVDVCFQKNRALITTLVVYPGASGSPMINTNGEVVGVMYAGSAGEWGYAIVLADLKSILKGR